MAEPYPPILWNQPEWIEQAHAWITRAVDSAGCQMTAPIEQLHARPWSTVMRVETTDGLLYFKACEPVTEPRMTLALSKVLPEHIPTVLAADLDRGWMLMRDAGPMLRTYLKSPADLSLVEPALSLFAGLQIQVIGQDEQFLAMGALDRRLEVLPDKFEALMADAAMLRVGEEDGLTAGQVERLVSILPRYREMCQELAAYRVPQTLHHDDFHDGNIFVSGSGPLTSGPLTSGPLTGGAESFHLVFSDWGETCITHPFFSMMLCLRSVGYRAGFPDQATAIPEGLPPELARLRDRYLAAWTAYEPEETLVKVFNLAWRVGMVSRALSWQEYINSLDDTLRFSSNFTYIVPAWLQEFLLAM